MAQVMDLMDLESACLVFVVVVVSGPTTIFFWCSNMAHPAVLGERAQAWALTHACISEASHRELRPIFTGSGNLPA